MRIFNAVLSYFISKLYLRVTCFRSFAFILNLICFFLGGGVCFFQNELVLFFFSLLCDPWQPLQSTLL